MLSTLMEAAKLAEAFSKHRQIKVRLEILCEGIKIDGGVYDRQGSRLHSRSLIIGWANVDEGRAHLEQGIRTVNAEMESEFRKAFEGA